MSDLSEALVRHATEQTGDDDETVRAVQAATFRELHDRGVCSISSLMDGELILTSALADEIEAGA